MAGARDVTLKLLSSYNISDKSTIYQHYDSEVQGRAVLRPGEADAAVAVFMPGVSVGLATSCGGNSRLAVAHPYLGGVWSVCEAVRNVACVGAEPLAITDCLNYGDPEDPAVFHEFSEGVRGIGDACRALQLNAGAGHGIPVVSGNVSFYNQSETGDAIAPTPVVACAGRIETLQHTAGMGFKRCGSVVVLVGTLHDKLGGSEYERLYGSVDPFDTPRPDFQREIAMIRALLDGFREGALLSAHDVSHGGIVVTVAEMILASAPHCRGCELDLTRALDPDLSTIAQLFSEYGGIVAEVSPDGWPDFENTLTRHGAAYHRVGITTDGGILAVKTGDGRLEVSFAELESAHKGRVGAILTGQDG
jgi:phosphoribosylformylglycinamidine synthase